MAFPTIPPEVAARVKSLFSKENRKKIAMELLFFDHWPKKEDRSEIAGRYNLSDSSIDKILYILRDNDFFTKEQGSIPLYRARLIEESSDERIDRMDSTERRRPKTDAEDSEEENLEDKEDKKESYENKVDQLEASVHSLKEGFNDFVSEMRTTVKSLSVEAPKDNPGEEKGQEAPPNENLVTPTPFSGMTGEQVYEIMLNQPNEFRELMGRGRSAMEGEIKAVPVTVRKIILNLTTYSLTCYEKAVNDGAFDGTLSDFINQCVYKFFEDRGLALGWHQVQPMRRSYQ